MASPGGIGFVPFIMLFLYAIVLGVFFLIAYFVIKKAVKDALKEYDKEKNQ